MPRGICLRNGYYAAISPGLREVLFRPDVVDKVEEADVRLAGVVNIG